MDKTRKGEIAWALLKRYMAREGIRFDSDFKRKLSDVAKETGIPLNELKEFVKMLTEEFLKETFGQ